ncbi:rbp11-like subunits of rna polymerase [Phaffia rhodozyma]|uniref:DNA-directed RNA polymerases I and III subunit RPAC2 n=1 Tax=Phaffia rhodozyma TaxID=264483 RepID=A0A0F7SJ01_PHARH|nr:rbp11-like subunits of rna polymerase [Phaffia rhodozyma]
MAEQGDFNAPVQIAEYDKEKITILPGASADLSAATFNIRDEDHTLGNALRWMVMKNPDVQFCGYSMPHPSEAKFHLRIQMYDNKSAVTCLLTALSDLRNLLNTVKAGYQDSLETDSIKRVQDVNVRAEVEDVLRSHAEAVGGGMEIDS